MSKTVLVAEDEAFLRDIIQMTLADHHVRVELASHGAEAIDAIEDRKPDLLLLDLLMPKADGYTVLRHIQDKGYQFPVIVLSNLSDPDEQDRCLQMGAKEFIIKSNLDEDELWDKVSPYLS